MPGNLFYGPFNGHCPVGGSHDAGGSFNYTLPFTAQAVVPQPIVPQSHSWTLKPGNTISAGNVTLENDQDHSFPVMATGVGRAEVASTTARYSVTIGPVVLPSTNSGMAPSPPAPSAQRSAGPRRTLAFTSPVTRPLGWRQTSRQRQETDRAFSLHAKGDIGPLIDSLIQDLGQVADAIGEFIKLIGSAPDPEPIQDPDPGSGGDGEEIRRGRRLTPPRNVHAVPISARVTLIRDS